MSLSFSTLLAVGVGGFLGSIARVLLNNFATKLFNSSFPYGVLIINLLGSFLIGVAFALFLHFNINENAKSFITAGFLGGFTTYSTFALESFLLFQTSLFLAFSNILLNAFGSVLCAAVGYKLAFYILGE